MGPGYERPAADQVRRAAWHSHHVAAAARAVEGRANHGRAWHARGQLHDGHGLYVAKGTPKEAVAALNVALRKSLADPGVLERLNQLGTLPFPESEMTPEAHARLFAAELPRVTKLVETSGVRASEAK